MVSLVVGTAHADRRGDPDDNLITKRFHVPHDTGTYATIVEHDDPFRIQNRLVRYLTKPDEGMREMISCLHSFQNEQTLTNRELSRELDDFDPAVIGVAARSDVSAVHVLGIADRSDSTSEEPPVQESTMDQTMAHRKTMGTESP